MEHEDIQVGLKVASFLLSYPNKEFYGQLSEYRLAVETMEPSDATKAFNEFFTFMEQHSQDHLIQTYITTFDFGKKTNLYVTYMTNGEQRERGMELLDIKNFYKAHGFEAGESELPDYLPIMLEFTSAVEREAAVELLGKYRKNIEEIRAQLASGKNDYLPVLHAINCLMRELGLDSVSEIADRGED